VIRFAKFVVALALVVAGPLVAQTTVEYIHTDALGSVVAVTDANRNVIDRREFAPYGDQLNAPAADRGPGYTGHVEDGLTGLTYMQQRYYDPAIGRFLSVDPVGPLSDPLQHFGRYQYAYNNPYRFFDPDGRRPIDEWIASLMGASPEKSGFTNVRDIVRADLRTLQSGIDAGLAAVKPIGTAGAMIYNSVDIRVEAGAAGGVGLSGSFSLLHGDGNLSVLGGEGAAAGIFIQPRNGISLHDSLGLKNPTVQTELFGGQLGKAGAKLGAGAVFGIDLSFDEGGETKLNGKVGLGAGALKGAAIEMVSWDGWNPEDRR
jgi:RHS repeat-associated protein